MMTNLMKIINGHKIDKDADLNGAYLYEANLENANLENFSLISANLEKSNLTGANLTGANLRFADLYGANLTGANLDGANLDGANFENAILDGVNLKGTIMEPNKNLKTKKLFDVIHQDLGYSVDCSYEILDAVRKWLPDSITDEETNPDKLWYNDFRNGYNKYRNDVIGNLE